MPKKTLRRKSYKAPIAKKKIVMERTPARSHEHIQLDILLAMKGLNDLLVEANKNMETLVFVKVTEAKLNIPSRISCSVFKATHLEIAYEIKVQDWKAVDIVMPSNDPLRKTS